MSAVFGFFGAVVSAIALAIAGAVTATVFVIMWKSGTLPNAWDAVTAFISGAWGALRDFFGFLRELVASF